LTRGGEGDLDRAAADYNCVLYPRKKTLAFPSARVYHSRRSYHHAANTDNKNWLPTNGQFYLRR
jgi:hypothetical protein